MHPTSKFLVKEEQLNHDYTRNFDYIGYYMSGKYTDAKMVL